ncbi:MAG: hypothetical protein ACR2FE_04010 [Aeromicrobium sp.]
MVLLLIALVALAAMLVALVRAVAEDGYGRRPPPRSHHAEEEPLDSWGLPIRDFGSSMTPR